MANSADWPVYVGWVLTGLGWFIVSKQANDREVRKEKRAEVDACCDMAADLLQKSREFYGEAGDKCEVGTAADLRFSVHRLLKRLQRLQRQHPKFKLKDAAGELMEAITGGDFDSKSRPALDANDPRLHQIEAACHFVIESLETGFEDSFITWSQRLSAWRHERTRYGRWRFLGREWG